MDSLVKFVVICFFYNFGMLYMEQSGNPARRCPISPPSFETDRRNPAPYDEWGVPEDLAQLLESML
jgi:hypothetical protein